MTDLNIPGKTLILADFFYNKGGTEDSLVDLTKVIHEITREDSILDLAVINGSNIL